MQGFEWVTCKRKRVNKDMKLYNRTANYNVGRCINWHTTVISTNAVILIPEISLKEITKYVDNDLIIRTIFKSLKTEIKV